MTRPGGAALSCLVLQPPCCPDVKSVRALGGVRSVLPRVFRAPAPMSVSLSAI